ncbi:MAG TPA: hypothetical protein PKD86_14915, partial [Gemmatales bacterium]|nr:hypothetical protein [Gemmatales bacterium]
DDSFSAAIQYRLEETGDDSAFAGPDAMNGRGVFFPPHATGADASSQPDTLSPIRWYADWPER